MTLAKAAATQTTVAQIQTAIDGIKTLLSAKVDQTVYDAKVKEIAGQIDAINKDLNTLTSGLKDEAEARIAADKDIEGQLATLKTFKESIDALNLTAAFPKLSDAVTTLQKSLETAQGDIKSNSDNITDLTKRMKAAEDAISGFTTSVASFATASSVKDLKTQLQSNIDVLNVLISKYLESLVFSPSFYYGGIEAIEVSHFDYSQAYKLKDAALSTTGEVWETKDINNTVDVWPTVVAKYYMNPSIADWNKIKKVDINFNTDNYLFYYDTRANAVDATTFTGKDGMLYVNIPNSESFFHSIRTYYTETSLGNGNYSRDYDQKIDVFTATAHYNDGDKDTTITSDFAAAVKAEINSIALADTSSSKLYGGILCNKTNNYIHLYTTAKDAISSSATHQLVYNDATGVDLTKLVQAHNIFNTGETAIDDLNNYGFKIEFALSEYLAQDGNVKTKQSIHAHLSSDGTHLIANAVDENGNAINDKQDISSVGRMPLVRYTLVDTKNNNNVIAIGYIKFEITSKEKAADIQLKLTDSNYNFGCGYDKSYTWSEIEANLLSKLGMSKADFENNYDMYYGGGSGAAQYSYTNGKFVALEPNYYIGTVSKTWNGYGLKNGTDVLVWTIDGTQLKKFVFDSDNNKYKDGVNLDTWIRFKSNMSSDADVYINLSTGVIAVPDFSKADVAKWADNGKIKQLWAAAAGAVGSGYAEIHNHVDVIGQPNADATNFKRSITSTLEGDSVRLSGVDNFLSFYDKLRVVFEFDNTKYDGTIANSAIYGLSGAKYCLKAVKDINGWYTTIYAAKVNPATPTTNPTFVYSNEYKIASLSGLYDPSNHKGDQYIYNYDVKYEYIDNNASRAANDILNASASLTAKVVMTVLTNCDMPVFVKNNTFDVRFLRPVSIKAGSAEIQDGQTAGSTIEIKDNFIDFRNLWGDATAKAADYVTYYGVTSVKVVADAFGNVAGATTDLNNHSNFDVLLSDIRPDIKLTYASNASGLLGTVKYLNLGNQIGDFNIRIPVIATYKWGELSGYVQVKVKKTLGAAKSN